MKGFIYQYTFPDGKVYIGQTRRPIELRHREHINPSTGILNPGFWDAYQTVGEPTLTILETVEAEDLNTLVDMLNDRETTHILLNHASDPCFGYNRMSMATAYSPDRAILKKEYFRLCEQTELERQPFFDSILQKFITRKESFTEEESEFIRGSLLDNNIFADPLLDEINPDDLSILESADGFFFEEALEFAIMVYKEETEDIIRRYVEENADDILRRSRQGKIIQQLDKDGNVLHEFWSQEQICEAFHLIRIDNIINVIKGRQKSAYGYYWRYKPNDE